MFQIYPVFVSNKLYVKFDFWNVVYYGLLVACNKVHGVKKQAPGQQYFHNFTLYYHIYFTIHIYNIMIIIMEL